MGEVTFLNVILYFIHLKERDSVSQLCLFIQPFSLLRMYGKPQKSSSLNDRDINLSQNLSILQTGIAIAFYEFKVRIKDIV